MTRQHIETICVGKKYLPESKVGIALPKLNAPACENTNSVEQDLGLQGGIVEDWKIERLEKSFCHTHVTSSMSSYKPQNAKTTPIGLDGQAAQALWLEIQEALKADLNTAAWETWIKPSRLDSIEDSVATLAIPSEFNRDLVAKRYRPIIEEALSAKVRQPITLRLRVDTGLELPIPATKPVIQPAATPNDTQATPCAYPANNPKYPLARSQNPTNSPEVALLLEKYGDIRGVMKNHPFFKRIQRPIEDGGWGTDLGGLIYLAKQYTLERVLWAAKQAKDYQGAGDRGAVFTYAVKKGLEER